MFLNNGSATDPVKDFVVRNGTDTVLQPLA